MDALCLNKFHDKCARLGLGFPRRNRKSLELYLYSGGGECHCRNRVVHHVHPPPQSHPVVMATTTQQTALTSESEGCWETDPDQELAPSA